MSPHKWIKETSAIGIVSKTGNNGGTFAHSDIAFEFARRQMRVLKENKGIKDLELLQKEINKEEYILTMNK